MTRTICAVLGFALCVAACSDEQDATEVIIVIDADPEVKERSSGLRLQIESWNDGPEPADPEVHDDVQWPFKVALTPRDGDATREYRVTAEALEGNGAFVAAARIISGFVAGEQRRVRMVIEKACIDVELCENDRETCHLRETSTDERGTCTDARVDPDALGHGETPELGDLLDDPSAPDSDAGSDAGTDPDSAVDAGPDDSGQQPETCGSDNGGCDPLSECRDTPQGPICGACPANFAGDGENGCEPRLIDLTVSPGQMDPTFSAAVTDYRVHVPIATQRIEVIADAPAETSLSIEGETATSGEAWTSGVLAAGESDLSIEVSAESGDPGSYALVIARGEQQAYVKASNTGQSAYFGGAVAISGDTMVIGAEGEDSSTDPLDDELMDSGAAYVFVREGGVWREQARLKASNAGVRDAFGAAVAISGDTIVIGAPLEDSSALNVGGNQNLNDAEDSGAAYVFVRAGAVWSQHAYLKASNTGAIDRFGASVAIDGATIAVGARSEGSNATGVGGDGNNNGALASGAAYAFMRDNSSWAPPVYLKPPNTGNEHLFGSCVAVGGQGATIAVGAPGDNDDDNRGRGSAFVFTHDGNAWMYARQLKSETMTPGEAFGYSVAMSGDTLVVGTSTTILADALLAGVTGAVHVFEGDDGFNTARKLTAINLDPGDNFGASVAIDGDLVLVGAPREGGSERGIHPSASAADNDALQSGAAYVFERNATSWTSLAYLKASNVQSSDNFGTAVAVSAGSLVVGAHSEDGSATGVNMGADAEADNDAAMSGAVYVFH